MFGARLDVFKSGVAARTKPGIRECVRGCRNEPEQICPAWSDRAAGRSNAPKPCLLWANLPPRQCSVSGPYPSEHDAEAGSGEIPRLRAIMSVSHHAVEVPKRSGCGIKMQFHCSGPKLFARGIQRQSRRCQFSTDLACVQTHQPLLRLRAAWLETIALSAEDYSFR